jgi:hypothetical protein
MKRFLLLVVSASYCLVSYSQESIIAIGFHLSPVITTLRQNYVLADYDSRLSFSTGLNLEFYITQKISVKSGLTFERNSTKSNIYQVSYAGMITKINDTKHYCDYLIIPVLASFSTKGNYKLYLNSGPFIGFLINQKVKAGIITSYPEATVFNVIEEKRVLDLGISIGFGLSHPIGKNLVIDIGFNENLGVFNINKSEQYDNSSIKTNSIGLNLGIKYQL